MTVVSEVVQSGPFTPNGVTVDFPFTFEISATDEVEAVLDGEVLDPSLYSVTLDDNGTGEVTFFTAPTGDELFLNSNPSFGQPSTLQNQGPYFQRTLEQMLDRAAEQALWLRARLLRLLPSPYPTDEELAGNYLSWDAEGNPVISAGTGADAGLRTDLADDEGGALVGLSHDFADAPLQSMITVFREGPVLKADYFRKATDTDDTDALTRALAHGLPVFLPAGRGSGTLVDDGVEGCWLLGDVEPPSGAMIFGSGMGKTVCRPNKEAVPVWGHRKACFHFDSGASDEFIRGVRLSDMTLYGWSEDDGFAEFAHLVHFNGAEDCSIDRVEFKGFQGDGLQFGRGRIDALCHNKRIRVNDCLFDGIDRNNRNAISIIDGDDVRINASAFYNCSRNGDGGYVSGAYDVMDPLEGPGMPGPIDFEPDGQADTIIQNTTVDGCTFISNGGNVAQVGWHIPAVVTMAPVAMTVRDCFSAAYGGSGSDLYLNTGRVHAFADTTSTLLVIGWRGYNGTGRPFVYYNGKGIKHRNCVWQGYDAPALVGAPSTATFKPRDVDLEQDLIDIGGANGGITIGYLTGNSRFAGLLRDCVYGLQFGAGTSEAVDIRELRVDSPSAVTTHAVLSSGHTFTRGSNRSKGASLGGFTSQFQEADRVGTVALVAGVATITTGVAIKMVSLANVNVGGTPGVRYQIAGTATDFTITAKDASNVTQALDTSTLAYEVTV